VKSGEDNAPPGSVLVDTYHKIELNVTVSGRFVQPNRDVTTSGIKWDERVGINSIKVYESCVYNRV